MTLVAIVLALVRGTAHISDFSTADLSLAVVGYVRACTYLYALRNYLDVFLNLYVQPHVVRRASKAF